MSNHSKHQSIHLEGHSYDFLDKLELSFKEKADISPDGKITVSELTGLPIFIYEKLRNIIDYKDEYLLRKNAIKRYLKRYFFITKYTTNPEKTALDLVTDLILSRYIKNSSIPETKLAVLSKILTKYHLLYNYLDEHKTDVKDWHAHILGLAAVECDNVIVSPTERNAYTALDFSALSKAIDYNDSNVSQETVKVQIILNIQKILERADRDILWYYLMAHYYQPWFTMEPAEAAEWFGVQIKQIFIHINGLLDHPVGKKVQTRVKKLTVPVLIIMDAVKEAGQDFIDVVNDPVKFEQKIRAAYRRYWKNVKKRIRRKGINAITYIFLTKMVLAVLIEIPYERIFLKELNYIALTINLLFPPILMAFITIMIKSPSINNEDKVVEASQELIYGETDEFYKPRQIKHKKFGPWAHFFYALLYILTIGGSFGLITYILWRLNFNVLSGALFIFFVSLVSFFGISLRQQARQISVLKDNDNFFTFIIDFFALPVIAFGKWLSTTFDKINIFVFILDFMFELPFKTLLKVIEEWFQFLKEKKDQMY